MKHILILASGTGGHIFPGLVIAENMASKGWLVSWLGTRHGMESEIISHKNIIFNSINFSGIRGKGLYHGLIGLYKFLRSIIYSFFLLNRLKPNIIFGMGGYATVPPGIVSVFFKAPLVLLNSDKKLILSNKILYPFAKKIFFGFELNKISKNKKEILTGNPVRKEMKCEIGPKFRYENRSGKLNILVLGGSLGAKILNENIPKALSLISVSIRPNVIHQSGKKNILYLSKIYKDLKVKAEVIDFIIDIDKKYLNTDLIICRAGAITISEICSIGIASLLVPLQISSTTHQIDNAVWMYKNKAALHLPQNELNPVKIASIIKNLSREKCKRIASKAFEIGFKNSNEKIISILESLLEK
tara:strand:+ start:551 stop:1624 length:1074 start_codon:yes stop_codon:yes gene_type:complete